MSWGKKKRVSRAPDVVWTSENYVTPLFTRGVVQEVDPYLTKDKGFKPSDYFDTVLNS